MTAPAPLNTPRPTAPRDTDVRTCCCQPSFGGTSGLPVASRHNGQTFRVPSDGGQARAGLSRRNFSVPQADPSIDTACTIAPGAGTMRGDGATRRPGLKDRETCALIASAPHTHSTPPTYPEAHPASGAHEQRDACEPWTSQASCPPACAMHGRTMIRSTTGSLRRAPARYVRGRATARGRRS
jgi:hypothetical protein